jgi:putative ABC transport system permease protein
MFRSYLLIAFRNLGRKKVFATINTVGLAVGLACCLLLGLYIEHHLSFDRFHAEADRIYRVQVVNEEIEGGTVVNARSTPLLGPAVEEEFSAVERSTRVIGRTVTLVAGENEHPLEVLFADPAFFDVFSFNVTGRKGSMVLDGPESIVLSRSAAERIFGNDEALGQRIDIAFRDETRSFIVSGLAADAPEVSTIRFDAVLPFDHARLMWAGWSRQFAFETWQMPVSNLFVMLRPGTEPHQVSEGIHALLARHGGEDGHGQAGVELLPLRDVHLSSNVRGGLAAPGNAQYLRILGGIALLILLLACINFVTLTLGMSTARAREVGVRKTLGARREQVTAQFWSEALLLTGIALLMAIVLTALALPVAGELLQAPLAEAFSFQPIHLLYLAGIVGAVAFLAGAYPALVLSAQRPVRVLSGSMDLKGHNVVMRPLVVTQFAISIALIVIVIGMSVQLRYMADHDLGLPDRDLLVVDLGESTEGGRLYEPLKAELVARPEVAAVSGSFFSFGSAGIDIELRSEGDEPVRAHFNPVDDNFVEALGLQLVAGQSLTERTSDRSVLVNETLVRRLGWDDPIGRTLPVTEGAGMGRVMQNMTVQGVVRDYHVKSLHEEIPPLVLARRSVMGGGVMAAVIRFETTERAAGIELVRAAWERVAPERPLQYTFLGDAAAAAYREEARWRTLMQYAAAIAILIAVLGLFGLAALAAERRRKEIGVRKVLGAGVSRLLLLLSREFVVLVTIAIAIATPVAYWAMGRWLEDFAYRIEPGPGVFLLAGGVALAIALLTVSYHALRAALTDPVRALRTE